MVHRLIPQRVPRVALPLAVACAVVGHAALLAGLSGTWHQAPGRPATPHRAGASPGVRGLTGRFVLTAAVTPARAHPTPPPMTEPVLPAHASTRPVVFWPTAALQRGPVPVSAPDTSELNGLTLSGRSLQLRLLIDATGRVVDVLPLVVEAGDESAFASLRAMFTATAFVPGRRGHRDVASHLDLEVSVARLGT